MKYGCSDRLTFLGPGRLRVRLGSLKCKSVNAALTKCDYGLVNRVNAKANLQLPLDTDDDDDDDDNDDPFDKY